MALRARAVAGLAFLGLAIDAEKNARTTGDGDVSDAGARGKTVVVASREDLQIARLVGEALAH